MAYQVGQPVFVPSKTLPNGDDYPFALYHTEVREVEDRSVKVRERGGGTSDWIASSKCHQKTGILIVCVGDNETEATLLDPLSKSFTQFCRLLLEDSFVRSVKVRSLDELNVLWSTLHGAYSHLVVIGHGNGEGLKFAVNQWITSQILADTLNRDQILPKLVISMTCQAGRMAFARPISTSNWCKDFIGAFDAVHGAVASQFAQSFLTYQLLEGETVKVAFKHAKSGVPGSSVFRLWRRGELA